MAAGMVVSTVVDESVDAQTSEEWFPRDESVDAHTLEQQHPRDESVDA